MSKKYKPYWDKTISIRKKIGSPGRPSKAEAKIYERLFRKVTGNKRYKAVILGSTPELRDIVLKHKSEVTAVDISLDALLKLRYLMKQNWEDEILIRDNWLHMPLESNEYRVVLGDLIFANLFLKDWDNLLIKLRELISKGGYFILREHLAPPLDRIKNQTNTVYNRCLIGKEHSNTLFINFLYLTYHNSDKSYSANLARNLLKLYLQNKVKTKQVRNLVNNLLVYRCWDDKKWFMLPQKLLERKLSKYFIIKGRYFGQDHFFSEYFPIYLLKVRK